MLGTLMDLIRGVGAGLQEAKNAGEEVRPIRCFPRP